MVVGMLVLVVMVIIPISSIQFLFINVFNQQPSDQQQIQRNISTLIKDNIQKNTHNKTKNKQHSLQKNIKPRMFHLLHNH